MKQQFLLVGVALCAVASVIVFSFHPSSIGLSFCALAVLFFLVTLGFRVVDWVMMRRARTR